MSDRAVPSREPGRKSVRFAASNVTIVRRYEVDCAVCQDAVDTSEGIRGALSRTDAVEAKREHVEWHRRQG
jgi:hypothetical protein